MSYDLNDARVEALRLATDYGLTVHQFNAIWTTIMRGAAGSRQGQESTS